ncbi:hypothetical protein A2210_01960 [Candidatus Woesebacteria bacterium RIFOXYA1_FULL_40_18]|nr:MAG: hypothetical protein A2210_01960 [Candidatus Woesebacteria bacterium RIFOXYA1_FULL_40_18]OGM80573.1 MAG: hypothetical protein A2361_02530 [Candidatus Woesebacteria bacterium RIFOXYB1_FULL_40_26]
MNGSLFGAFDTGFRTQKQRSPGFQAGESSLLCLFGAKSILEFFERFSQTLSHFGEFFPTEEDKYNYGDDYYFC